MMKDSVYTSIPDTSDTNYWQALPYNQKDRTTRFIPRDQELHQRLKTIAWQAIQKRLGPAKSTFMFKQSPVGPAPATGK